MTNLLFFLSWAGFALIVCAWFLVVIVAFRKGVLGGLVCMLFCPACLVFMLLHSEEENVRRAFCLFLAGFAAMFIAC